jgi:hypothetical protein
MSGAANAEIIDLNLIAATEKPKKKVDRRNYFNSFCIVVVFGLNETEELMSRCCRSIPKRVRGRARLSAEDPESDISSSRKSRKCDTHTIAS